MKTFVISQMNDPPSVSWLFVPADRPDRFEKSVGAGADETIIDLEDALAPDAKLAAREHVVRWLAGGRSAWVRINGAVTSWHAGDLDALKCCAGLRGVVVPKAEAPGVLAQIARRLDAHNAHRSVVALIETAAGLRNLDAICATPGVSRLAFGSIDLALDIDAQDSDEALLYARSEMIIASRAAGLPSPIDGVTVEFRDSAVVAAAAARSRALGFGGKLCIHPAQVPVVNAEFAPTPADLDWARRVVAAAHASGGGVFAVDDRMVDRPLLERAHRLLARSASTGVARPSGSRCSDTRGARPSAPRP